MAQSKNLVNLHQLRKIKKKHWLQPLPTLKNSLVKVQLCALAKM